MSKKESFGQTEYCDTDSTHSDNTDQEKQSKTINKVREWYNQRLQSIITESTDIDLVINDNLDISIEDQYSAQYITTDDFGILHSLIKRANFTW
jgi:hypothetical protein